MTISVMAIVFLFPQSSATAQAPTSIVPMPVRAPSADTIADSLKKPPLSPGKAFLTSLLLPGYAQSRLDRPMSSMLYAAFEVLSIGMARKSAQDLREAKQFENDSVVSSYSLDPTTGQITPASYTPSRFTLDRIQARRLHYEDWIAAVIFNHLISGADAYVAANLWDFNANVSVSNSGPTATVSASRSF